jgi:hypothetical protein
MKTDSIYQSPESNLEQEIPEGLLNAHKIHQFDCDSVLLLIILEIISLGWYSTRWYYSQLAKLSELKEASLSKRQNSYLYRIITLGFVSRWLSAFLVVLMPVLNELQLLNYLSHFGQIIFFLSLPIYLVLGLLVRHYLWEIINREQSNSEMTNANIILVIFFGYFVFQYKINKWQKQLPLPKLNTMAY